MSVDCAHGSFGSHLKCPDCRMDRIEALLERIADAVAPTPEQQAERRAIEEQHLEDRAFTGLAETLKRIQAAHPPRIATNAIAGPQTGRGVR